MPQSEGHPMRLTLIQMNSRTAARDENVERACAFVDEAAELRPDLVVLPEFFNTETCSPSPAAAWRSTVRS